jgi:hypothetical protein
MIQNLKPGPTKLEPGFRLGVEVSLKDFRKDIIIEVYNEAGQVVLAAKSFDVGFRISRRFQNWMPVQTLSPFSPSRCKMKDGNDYEVVEPTEPSFTEP